jgi:hypothetical protein
MMVVQQTATGRPTDPTVEDELDRLAVMPIVQLRARYREVFKSDPPKAFGPDLLRRSIAHRIQEKAYGSLSRPAQHLLGQMVKAYAAKPNGKIVLPRRIKPGSLLVREWKGKSHRVMVVANGFAYDGETFTNLSEIAVLITGTRWNGPRFFGLRSKPDENDAAAIRSTHSGRRDDARQREAGPVAKRVPIGNRHGR